MADENRTTLSGGAIADRVTKVGAVVHRPAGSWTRDVHTLLEHLRNKRFLCPRPLAIDGEAETLEFLEGTVVWHPGTATFVTDAALVDLAQLLRRFHDAAETFVPRSDARWQRLPGAPTSGAIVCHNDFAPWNVLGTPDGPLALIDWDLAAPADAIWDVAYACWTCVPLWNDDDLAPRGLGALGPRGPRLRAFVDAYGLDAHERGALLDVVRQRQLVAREQARVWAEEERPGWRGQWSLPEPWRHGRGFDRDVTFLEVHRAEWNSHLQR